MSRPKELTEKETDARIAQLVSEVAAGKEWKYREGHKEGFKTLTFHKTSVYWLIRSITMYGVRNVAIKELK